ncbi:MAG: PEGA domain-containing protein [Acidobacteria bacterium]|nr:PEGA domain-containing protein [Acidobacteriota bacterium]
MTGEALPSSVPAAFGRFRVLHQISAGSLGPVFRGEDPTTGETVAIKVIQLDLPPERAHEITEGLRALQARLPADRAVAPIVAAGLQGPYPYLVSRLVPGVSLDVALREFGPAIIADALPRLAELGTALDLAARGGSCHGDLHPRDVIINDDDTTLVGVGIAPIVERSVTRMPTRWPYTSPEVMAGQLRSPASDQYALAAIAFEWLYGRRVPGPADVPLEVPPLVGADREALSDAFTSALAVEPSARFDSCRAFVEALAHAVRLAESPMVGPTRQERQILVPPLPLLDVEEPSVAKAGEAHDAVFSEDRLQWASDATAEDAEASEPTDDLPDELMLSASTAAELRDISSESDAVGALGLTVPPPPVEEQTPAPPVLRPSQGAEWRGTFGSTPLATSESRGFGLAAVAAALMIGLVLGGALVFMLVRRDALSRSAQSGGQEFTDAPVAASPSPPADGRASERIDPPPEPERPAPPVSRTTSPPAAPSVAPASSGRLLVRSTPSGAEVSVNGTRRGVTPVAVRDLPLGTHTVVFTRPGYVRAEQRIALTRGRPSRSVDARLIAERTATSTPVPPRPVRPPSPAAAASRATGTLLVESRPPGARVTVDGKAVGTTPLTLESLTVGTHEVRIERDGYTPWTTTVTVEAGARARVAASLGAQ